MRVLRRCAALLWLLAAALLGAEAPPAFEIGPYLTHLGTDRVTVSWQTREPAAGWVECSRGAEAPRVLEEARAQLLHHATLDGLATGREYRYRVTSGDVATPFRRFMTAPEKPAPFRFAQYGDSCENPEVHRRVARAIASHHPAFVVHTGDFLLQGDKGKRWAEDFFAPARELLAEHPLVVTCGDNERRAMESCCDLFGLPRDRTWYAWSFGGVEFFVLDSCAALEAPTPALPVNGEGVLPPPVHGGIEGGRVPGSGAPQVRWLAEALAASRARWKIAVVHHPLYSCGRHGAHDGLRRSVIRLFLRHGVDLVLSGHDHLYERSRPIGEGPEPARNALVQIVSGGGGQSLSPAVPQAWTAQAASRHGFCLFDVEREQITVTAYSDADEPLDRFVLSKKDGRKSFESALSAEQLEVIACYRRFDRNRFPFVRGTAHAERFEFPVRNPFEREIRGELSWEIANRCWRTEPLRQGIVVPPGGEVKVRFEAAYAPEPGAVEPDPIPRAVLTSGDLRATALGVYLFEDKPRTKGR